MERRSSLEEASFSKSDSSWSSVSSEWLMTSPEYKAGEDAQRSGLATKWRAVYVAIALWGVGKASDERLLEWRHRPVRPRPREEVQRMNGKSREVVIGKEARGERGSFCYLLITQGRFCHFSTAHVVRDKNGRDYPSLLHAHKSQVACLLT